MKALLVWAVVSIGTAWGESIPVSGTFIYGLDLDNLRFSGPNLNFQGSDPSTFAPIIMCSDAYTTPCNLSYSLPASFLPSDLGGVIAEYNGHTTAPCPSPNCARSSGTVLISSAPFLFGPNPCRGGGDPSTACTTPSLPIMLSGEIVTTYVNTSTVLFDGLLTGTGTMTAKFSDFGGGAVPVWQIAGQFTGVVSITPEPASFILLSAGLILIVGRRQRRCN